MIECDTDPDDVFISRLVWYWAGTLLRIDMLRIDPTVKPSTWILSIDLWEVEQSRRPHEALLFIEIYILVAYKILFAHHVEIYTS